MSDIFFDVIDDTSTTYVVFQLRIADPAGIRAVNIWDNAGIGIDVSDQLREYDECSSAITLTFEPMLRSRLPLAVEVINCEDVSDVDDNVGGMSRPDDVEPSPRMPCNPTLLIPPTPACTRAQQTSDNIRTRFVSLCSQIETTRIGMITMFTAAAVMFALAIAFMIAAAVSSGFFIFGAAVSAFYIAFAIAAMAAGFALLSLANRLFNQLTRLQGQKNEIAEEFDQAVIDVRNHCCPSQITSNLDPPC